MSNFPDNRLDTISSSIGYGVQVQTRKTPAPNYANAGTHYPAPGLQLGIFTAASADEGGSIPSAAADLFLSKQDTDKLIALLQEHRARMEPVPAAVVGSAA